MKDQILKIFTESAEVKMDFARENTDIILSVIELVIDTFKAGKKLLLFGNGGSAADAQHLAGEFINRFLVDRKGLPAIALTTDTSVLTCIGNDYNFSDIFSRQIEALGQVGDIAIGISTSGNSQNVVLALQKAKAMGLKTIGLTGNKGGKIAREVDYLLNVSSSSTPRIQETHITVGHIICQLVEQELVNSKFI